MCNSFLSFSLSHIYISKISNKDYTNNWKTCKYYICNEECYYASQCPKIGKREKKLIKFLEEQENEVLYGQEFFMKKKFYMKSQMMSKFLLKKN